MQAIFDWSGELQSWSDLVDAFGSIALPRGHRWDDVPELRDFIASARGALVAGEPLRLDERPACVHVHHWMGRAPGIGQKGHCPNCDAILRTLGCSGHVAHLVRNVAHAYGLAKRLPYVMKLYESGDPTEPLKRIERAQQLRDDPPALVLHLVDTLRAWGGGIEKDLRTQLTRLCKAEGFSASSSKKVGPWKPIVDGLYAQPDAHGWLRGFKRAVDLRANIGWNVVRRDPTYLLWAIPDDAPDLILAAQAVGRARRGRSGPPSKVMTVTRSKGMQFDAVVLPYVGADAFPDNDAGRRHLYVAVTRAQHELHFLIPTEKPSPLVTVAAGTVRLHLLGQKPVGA